MKTQIMSVILTGVGLTQLGFSRGLAGEVAPYAAPALFAMTALNNGGRSTVNLHGKVTLLHFWTFDCINCKHNLPAYQRLQKRLESSGFQLVSVHTPETQGERSLTGLRQAVKRQGISYPVLVDNQETNWHKFGLDAWPTVFVIDKKGKVRGKWVGELNFGGQSGEAEVAALVNKLESEKGS